ncbi:MAG: Catechol-2,3-dioxygenase [Actinomycetota bacterium]|jgi:catechol-2,3-dioxygenase
MGIVRLNHAVLYVSDASASARFYADTLDFEVAGSIGDAAIFLRAPDSDNDHDLGLFHVGSSAASSVGGRATHRPGLYHLAWQVRTIEELAVARDRLRSAGALIGESDHGVSKSLYARDPDGIEFEVMWAVPRDEWPAEIGTWRLDLAGALARWPGVDTSVQ